MATIDGWNFVAGERLDGTGCLVRVRDGISILSSMQTNWVEQIEEFEFRERAQPTLEQIKRMARPDQSQLNWIVGAVAIGTDSPEVKHYCVNCDLFHKPEDGCRGDEALLSFGFIAEAGRRAARDGLPRSCPGWVSITGIGEWLVGYDEGYRALHGDLAGRGDEARMDSEGFSTSDLSAVLDEFTLKYSPTALVTRVELKPREALLDGPAGGCLAPAVGSTIRVKVPTDFTVSSNKPDNEDVPFILGGTHYKRTDAERYAVRLVWWPNELPAPFFAGEKGSRTFVANTKSEEEYDDASIWRNRCHNAESRISELESEREKMLTAVQYWAAAYATRGDTINELESERDSCRASIQEMLAAKDARIADLDTRLAQRASFVDPDAAKPQPKPAGTDALMKVLRAGNKARVGVMTGPGDAPGPQCHDV